MKIWGIDVSKYNYPIDWKKVKSSGVKFAILRCGYAPTNNRTNLKKDPYFEQFYKEAKTVGMPVGVYFYSRCNSQATAKAEARFIINCLKGKKLEYPVFLDVEDITTLKNTSKKTLTNAVKTCLDELEKAGYYVGIYSGTYILRDNLNDNELKDYDHWIAAYTKVCPYKGEHTMWQFGGETNYLRSKYINGIGSDVADQNYCYVDYPSIINKAGLNGLGEIAEDKKGNIYKVIVDTLNVRSEPSITDENIVGKLKKGDEVQILEIKESWGKISLNKWINLKYCEKL